jgi:endonuclease/exonuclease/phosphatase family metal-dependent hydrolase
MRLTFATYNIHRCIGRDGRYDPNRIRDVIRELDADVIAVQEIDSPDRHGLELAHWLGKESELQVIAGPTLLERKGHHGNAVLTRCQRGEIRLLDLSFPDREPRGAIDLDLSCGGIVVQVIATHLGLRPKERRTQVQRLLERVGPNCVLMGDFNEWWLWGHTLRWIKAIFGHAPALPTFPSLKPVFALDRIWIRPPASLKTIAVHRTPLSAQASDHLPLKAVVEWNRTESAGGLACQPA